MKEIKLSIEDDVFAELKSSIILKQMTGNMYGVLDEFIGKLLKTMDAGDTELHLEFSKKRKKGKKK